MASHSRRSSPTFFYSVWARSMTSDGIRLIQHVSHPRMAKGCEPSWEMDFAQLHCAGCHRLPSPAIACHVSQACGPVELEQKYRVGCPDSQHLNSWWVNYRMNQVGYDQVTSSQVSSFNVSQMPVLMGWVGSWGTTPLKGQISVLAVATGWNEGGAPQRAATVSWFITALTMVYGTYWYVYVRICNISYVRIISYNMVQPQSYHSPWGLYWVITYN